MVWHETEIPTKTKNLLFLRSQKLVKSQINGHSKKLDKIQHQSNVAV